MLAISVDEVAKRLSGGNFFMGREHAGKREEVVMKTALSIVVMAVLGFVSSAYSQTQYIECPPTMEFNILVTASQGEWSTDREMLRHGVRGATLYDAYLSPAHESTPDELECKYKMSNHLKCAADASCITVFYAFRDQPADSTCVIEKNTLTDPITIRFVCTPK